MLAHPEGKGAASSQKPLQRCPGLPGAGSLACPLQPVSPHPGRPMGKNRHHSHGGLGGDGGMSCGTTWKRESTPSHETPSPSCTPATPRICCRRSVPGTTGTPTTRSPGDAVGAQGAGVAERRVESGSLAGRGLGPGSWGLARPPLDPPWKARDPSPRPTGLGESSVLGALPQASHQPDTRASPVRPTEPPTDKNHLGGGGRTCHL